MSEDALIAGLVAMRSRAKTVSPPVSAAAIQNAEAALGFTLPALLAKLYGQVANGGFGPGYGIMGLDGGHTNDDGDSCVKLYRKFRMPYRGKVIWPDGYLPVCYGGCSLYSVLDCSSDAAPVLAIDLADGCSPSAFRKESASLLEWLDAWFRGVSRPA